MSRPGRHGKPCIVFRFPDAEIIQLRRVATALGKPYAEICREALRTALRAHAAGLGLSDMHTPNLAPAHTVEPFKGYDQAERPWNRAPQQRSGTSFAEPLSRRK